MFMTERPKEERGKREILEARASGKQGNYLASKTKNNEINVY